jgi:hypothetical protein
LTTAKLSSDYQQSEKKFDGTEPIKGLGANFTAWGTRFMRDIVIAQHISLDFGGEAKAK